MSPNEYDRVKEEIAEIRAEMHAIKTWLSLKYPGAKLEPNSKTLSQAEVDELINNVNEGEK